MIADREALTPREIAVLLCVWNGLTRKEIAKELGLEDSTVANRLYIMYGKWRVSNTVQLVRKALELGILKVSTTTNQGALDNARQSVA